MAARPRTLTIALAPVLAGTALAIARGHPFRPGPMLVALAGALLIQAGTNLLNDRADALGGADRIADAQGPLRVGPPRVTAMGWASPRAVGRAAALCFALAAAAGLVLVHVGGWPIALLGGLSLLAGWAYSNGPWPISHTPLGEVCVIVFFGIGAVGGSAWLQAPDASLPLAILGLVVGCPAAGVLMVNNVRDAVPDRLAGRRTLALLVGANGARGLYAGLMLAPFPLLAALPMGGWAGLVALPWALACVVQACRHAPGPAYNRLLGATARCQMILAAATGAGLAAPALLHALA